MRRKKLSKYEWQLDISFSLAVILAGPLYLLANNIDYSDDLKPLVGAVLLSGIGVFMFIAFLVLGIVMACTKYEEVDPKRDGLEMYTVKNSRFLAYGKNRPSPLTDSNYVDKHKGFDRHGTHSFTYFLILSILCIIFMIVPSVEVGYIIYFVSKKSINPIIPILIIVGIIVIVELILFLKGLRAYKKYIAREDSLVDLEEEKRRSILVNLLRNEELSLVDGREYKKRLFLEAEIGKGRIFFQVNNDSLRAFFLTNDLVAERDRINRLYHYNVRLLNENLGLVLNRVKRYSYKLNDFDEKEIYEKIKKTIDNHR